jgi:hypothetical protein
METVSNELTMTASFGELANRLFSESAGAFAKRELEITRTITKGLDTYTKLMEVLRNLDEEIAIVVSQEG